MEINVHSFTILGSHNHFTASLQLKDFVVSLTGGSLSEVPDDQYPLQAVKSNPRRLFADTPSPAPPLPHSGSSARVKTPWRVG